MQKYFLILALICQNISGYCQLYTLDLISPENKVISQWLHTQPPRQDSLSWILARNHLFQSLHTNGYLLAELKEWNFSNDTLTAEIEPGASIHWAKISFKALEYLPPHWIEGLDVSGQVVDYEAWKSGVNKILKSAQAEGYLFADYKLEVLGLKNDSLEAEIIFNPGLKIHLDTVEVEGTAKLSDQYLLKSMGLKRGQPVTPEDLANLQQQLNNLRFIQQYSPPVMILIGEKATIRTYLNNRTASSFDILAGFQPAPDMGKGLSITGYVKLDLINQLLHGERMFLNIEKLRPRSQKLEMKLSYPYLLDLPFGVDGEFKLLKNDTLYSELEWKVGISFPFGKNQYVNVGIKQHSTNIISIDEQQIINTKKLPTYIDLRIKGLTLGLYRNRLDFDLNPRKGYTATIDGSFSQKNVVPNSLIEGLSEIDTTFDYSTLYDSLEDYSSRIALEGALQWFVPWGSRSTIRLAGDFGALWSGTNLYDNELFRIGGYARLRGFDEESILAQFYTILSAEYRLIIGGGSYVSFFTDYAWVKIDDVEFPMEDHPFGFGIGLNLETKAGIFGMRTAVGARQGNAIDFNNLRLHFGYVNRF